MNIKNFVQKSRRKVNYFTIFRSFSTEINTKIKQNEQILEEQKEVLKENSQPIVSQIKSVQDQLFSARLLDYFINPKRYNFLDKTEVIETLLEDNFTDIIIRPPNYGKSFSLNLLRYFLTSNTFSKKFFEGKNIINSSIEQISQFQSNYRVINLHLSLLDAPTFEGNIESLREQLIENFETTIAALVHNNDSFDARLIRDAHENLVSKTIDNELIVYSIQKLSRLIYRLSGKQAFLLVDDFDSPLVNAAKYDFYDKMCAFLRNLFSASIKNNENLFKTVITATFPAEVSKIFSNYKNLEIHQIENESKYSNSFGLTAFEAQQHLSNENSSTLLKSVYSHPNEDNDLHELYSYSELINSIKLQHEGGNYLNDIKIKESLMKLANEQSEDNSNIKLLCQLCVRSYQIVNREIPSPMFLKGSVKEDLNLSIFNSKLVLSQMFYNGLLCRVIGKDNESLYDLRNYAVASHILDNMPREGDFSNYQSRFILNYFINIHSNKIGDRPNIKAFLDYLKRLTSKKVKTKVDFPTFRFEKELKNFFLAIFAFDPEEFLIVNTLDNPVMSTLQVVINSKHDFAIVFDCKKLTKNSKSASRPAVKISPTGQIQENPIESDSEVKPETINDLKHLTDDSFRSIDKKTASAFVRARQPVSHIYYVVLSNYQRQFEYMMECDSYNPNNL